jgi:hypothetical protein
MTQASNLKRQLIAIVGSLLMSTIAVSYAVGPSQVGLHPAQVVPVA